MSAVLPISEPPTGSQATRATVRPMDGYRDYEFSDDEEERENFSRIQRWFLSLSPSLKIGLSTVVDSLFMFGSATIGALLSVNFRVLSPSNTDTGALTIYFIFVIFTITYALRWSIHLTNYLDNTIKMNKQN